jgi:hypothetical protein
MMHAYVKYIVLMPFWAICAQFYFHAVSQKAKQKQDECRILGITYTSFGIVSLVTKDMWFVMSGLVLIMLGLRLMAYSLDRIEKRKFIDRYEE